MVGSKKKQKSNKLFVVGGTFFVLLLIAAAVLLVQQTSLTSSDGDSYYEERCVDVQPYLSQGYSSAGVDSDGCPLASKVEYVGLVRITQDCDNVYKDYWCSEQAGPSYVWARTCEKPPQNSISRLVCGIPNSVVVGGLERVLNTCSYDPNDLLAAQTFTGGQVIDKDDLRYPVKSFCKAHPSIITDNDLLQSFTSTNVLQALIDGESVTIESQETLTVFYVIENNYQLPTVCDSGDNLAYDVETGVCKSTLGFTYLCSEGVFDALTGVCVVQPGVENRCEKGRYDEGLGVCVYNPPVQADCGTNNAYFSVDRKVCVELVQQGYDCPVDFDLYLPTEVVCDDLGGVWLECPQCPIDQVCPSSICEPECTKGVACTYNSSYVSFCSDNDAPISNGGDCVVGNDTISVCPGEMIWNKELQWCEVDPEEVVLPCSDGTQPVVNDDTGKLECLIPPSAFADCTRFGDFIYDSELDACVPYIDVVNGTGDGEVIYEFVFTRTFFIVAMVVLLLFVLVFVYGFSAGKNKGKNRGVRK